MYDADTGKRRYDNYQLIRVNPETDEHLDVLQFLDKGMCLLLTCSFIYFFTEEVGFFSLLLL